MRQFSRNLIHEQFVRWGGAVAYAPEYCLATQRTVSFRLGLAQENPSRQAVSSPAIVQPCYRHANRIKARAPITPMASWGGHSDLNQLTTLSQK